MTQTERFFIDVISRYLDGADIDAVPEFDAESLSMLCRIHKLTPVVYSYLAAHCRESAPPELLSEMKRTSLVQTAAQIKKTSAFLALYKKLSGEGFTVAVVKGITLRNIWPEPDLRLSSDEDLLTPAAGSDAVCSYLLANGFTEKECSDEDANVRAFYDSSSGLFLEVHNSLFPHTNEFNERMARLFDGALQRTVTEEIGGVKVTTLSPTDALLFLILHSFKHFVFCGFGLRQVADFAVFAKKYANSTNAEYIISSLKSASALRFFDALLNICDEFFGKSAQELGFGSHKSEVFDTSDLISDILSAGAYGNSTPERLHSSTITMSSAERGSAVSSSGAIFPPYSVMKERYPFVARHKILLPAGWVKRIFDKGIRRKKDFSASESFMIGKRRVAMLKKYGVIK